jgi:uncharacterized protein
MNCPACKGALREKSASGMVVDACYGGCGGIWFDRNELQRVDARGAASLHTVWRDPHRKVEARSPRLCPRCPDQVLQARFFGETEQVEIDECPMCGGLWLDEGEFTPIFNAIKGERVAPPGWAAAIAEVAAQLKPA